MLLLFDELLLFSDALVWDETLLLFVALFLAGVISSECCIESISIVGLTEVWVKI